MPKTAKPKANTPNTLLNAIKMRLQRLRRDEFGGFAIWTGLALPAMFAGAAFSVDASRLYSMDHDLQAGADALARAGAAELDRRDDSLVRATRAVQRLVRNDQKFSVDGRGGVEVSEIRFLRDTHAGAGRAPDSLVTNDPARAKFVEVSLAPESVDTIFPLAVVNGIVRTELSARATAGRAQRICGVAPVFVCNPYEGTNRTIFEAMDAGDLQKRLVQFKRPTGGGKGKGGKGGKGSKSTFGPGNFGFLEVPGANGASALRDAVAVDVPDICFDEGGTVRLKTGNINSMHHGFNVRFDIYGGDFKKRRTDPAYAPAANVVKGQAGPACRVGPSHSAMGLPRDHCHTRGDGQCLGAGRNIGDGQWDFVSYMARNHNYMRRIRVAGTTYTLDYRRWRVSPSQPPTRYAMYRWEIDNNCIPGPKTYGRHSRTLEEGQPTCHAHGA